MTAKRDDRRYVFRADTATVVGPDPGFYEDFMAGRLTSDVIQVDRNGKILNTGPSWAHRALTQAILS